MHKLFRIHRWQLALALGLLCLRRHHHFQHQGIDKNFFFLLHTATVYWSMPAAIVLLKSYDFVFKAMM